MNDSTNETPIKKEDNPALQPDSMFLKRLYDLFWTPVDLNQKTKVEALKVLNGLQDKILTHLF